MGGEVKGWFCVLTGSIHDVISHAKRGMLLAAVLLKCHG